MDERKLGEALWKVHLEHMRALDCVVERSYTRGETGVLLYLYHISRPLFPGELTEKLGLTTGRIANILRASLTTIYTYRSKLKARALNKDDFEAQVKAIEG